MTQPIRTLYVLGLLLALAACTGSPAPSAPSAPSPLPAPAAEPVPAAEPGEPALEAPLPVDPKVTVGRLDNGLTYIIRRNERPAERAFLRLAVDVGSVHEDEDQQGLAHFLEHMAFNGTQRFAKSELIDYLQSIGTRFGADINAYTNFEETVYMLTVPTDDPAVVEKTVQILADWASGITLDGEEIDKERGVVVEEWRLGRGAARRISDQQFPILFRGSRFAVRLPIGQKEILENAPYEALRRFYRDWYRPDLMAVVAVGDFDPPAIEALIQREFGAIPAASSPRPRPDTSVPDHDETLFGIITDPEATGTVVGVYTKLPVSPQGTYAAYRRSLVESLYLSMLNARLAEVTQQADPPFLAAGAGPVGFSRAVDLYQQAARVADGEVERGLEALLTEIERADRHGFTAGELERASAELLRAYEKAYEERDKLESPGFAAEYTRHFLEGESIPGIEGELGLVRRFLPTVTLEEVNRQTSEWISEKNRVILVSAPEDPARPLPAEEELLAVFEKVEASEIDPYVDRTVDEPLLATVPAPGAVVAERTVEEIGVTEWTLANGVRVVLKPTDFKNDEVLLSAFSPGGHSLAADEEFASARFATAAVGEGGLGEFDQVALGKALAGKVVTASPYLGELEEGIQASASPQDLETMLQLVYLSFTAPRRDEDAFRSLVSRFEALVANRQASPETVFQDAYAEALYQDHPRRRPITPELIDEIDLDTALRIYRDRFADAGDFTFILVGAFEPGRIKPLIETYLGGLPASGRQESWRDIGVETPDEVVEVEVRKGLEPKSQVQITFTGPAEWSRENVHDINTLATVLMDRYRELLREELGATYGVRVSGSISPRPRETYGFTIAFGCDPTQVDELVGLVMEEIDRLKREEVDEELLASTRQQQRRGRQVSLERNGFWVSVLGTYYNLGLDPRQILDYDALVERVTAERVRETARRYLDRDRYVIGVLYPEEAVGDDRDAGSAEE